MEDEYFMEQAIQEAEKGLAEEEVPVGCVITEKGVAVSRGHNMTNRESDPLSHAELVALRGCVSTAELTFYVTCEPCIMCLGVLERINARVFYGCRNSIFGDMTILARVPGVSCEMIYRERAVELLRLFFLKENQSAPPEKRKLKSKRRAKWNQRTHSVSTAFFVDPGTS